MTADRPAHPATARGLIGDTGGRWLIVRPTGGDHWHLPGGLIAQNESPAKACRREVREEIGIDLPPERLYIVGWNPPRRPGSRARFTFVFWMGGHDPDEIAARVQLQRSELDAWKWVISADALRLLHPDMADRLSAGARGLYFETHSNTV